MSNQTQIHVVDYSTQCPDNWFLVNDFLALRKQIFVEKLGWTIDTFRDLEFDQYDTFLSKYVVATESGEVVGGARLLRTDSSTPSSFGSKPYTYMVKDAHDGVLEGLPESLCYSAPPVSSSVWEITRLCSISNQTAPTTIMNECIAFLRSEGANEAIFICTPVGVRYARSRGRVVNEIGPVHSNDDGEFQAISFDVQ